MALARATRLFKNPVAFVFKLSSDSTLSPKMSKMSVLIEFAAVRKREKKAVTMMRMMCLPGLTVYMQLIFFLAHCNV